MTLLIAHRGEPVGHAENTLPAIEAAIRAGADMVEVDVRLTSDGVPVLLHDPELSRVWNDNRTLNQLTTVDLQHIALADGTAIPSLADAADLARLSGVQLMVDLPEESAGPAAHSLLARMGLTDLALFAGQATQVRVQSSSARIALSWDEITPPTPQRLDTLRPEYFNPHFQLLTADIADRMHQRGIKVSVWTVDHPRDMAAVIIQGADAVVTNHIADLVALVGSTSELSMR